jgi:hypothetical protein
MYTFYIANVRIKQAVRHHGKTGYLKMDHKIMEKQEALLNGSSLILYV